MNRSHIDLLTYPHNDILGQPDILLFFSIPLNHVFALLSRFSTYISNLLEKISRGRNVDNRFQVQLKDGSGSKRQNQIKTSSSAMAERLRNTCSVFD